MFILFVKDVILFVKEMPQHNSLCKCEYALKECFLRYICNVTPYSWYLLNWKLELIAF